MKTKTQERLFAEELAKKLESNGCIISKCDVRVMEQAFFRYFKAKAPKLSQAQIDEVYPK